jgi:hypothetical protein
MVRTGCEDSVHNNQSVQAACSDSLGHSWSPATRRNNKHHQAHVDRYQCDTQHKIRLVEYHVKPVRTLVAELGSRMQLCLKVLVRCAIAEYVPLS